MENRQQRELQKFERVLIYLERNPLKPEPPLLATMKETLTSSIPRVRQLELEQRTAMQGVSAVAMRSLRNYIRRGMLIPLARVAKSQLKFAPGVEPALHVPHARTNSTKLAAHTLAVAEAIAPHAELLASAGFGDDFVAELREKGEKLGSAAARADEARQLRARATADIRHLLKEGNGAVDVIEGILRRRGTVDDRALMEWWRSSRRVQGRVGRPPQRRKRPPPLPPS